MKIIIPLCIALIMPLSAMAGEFAPMALNSLASIPTKIAGAKVVDPHGAQIGSLTRIQTNAKGKPLKADIALTGGGSVSLDASMLGYDQNTNVLVTAAIKTNSRRLGVSAAPR
jgi:hypothetical protein